MSAPAVTIGTSRIELVQGDITQQELEAIANAANSRLAGGGGVDGAIHRAGGPELMAELKAKYPQGCPTGQAVITGSFNFTKAAEERNAENLLVIRDKALADRYNANWHQHEAHSQPY